MKTLPVVTLMLCLFVLSGCEESDSRKSDLKHISKFKEGALLNLWEPEMNYDAPDEKNFMPFHSGFFVSLDNTIKQKARILKIIENKPGDFQYAEMVPYTLVLGYKQLSSNGTLRGIEITPNGRSFTWRQLPEPEKTDPDTCTNALNISDELLDYYSVVLNIVRPSAQNPDQEELIKKIQKLRTGDIIKYMGRTVHLVKEGDPQGNVMSTASRLRGPSGPGLIVLSNLININHQYRAQHYERRCMY